MRSSAFLAMSVLLATACKSGSDGDASGEATASDGAATSPEDGSGTSAAEGTGDAGDTGESSSTTDGESSTTTGGETTSTTGEGPPGATEENLRVAFLGDQGLGPDPIANLNLVRDEGADFLIILGDFDYVDLPMLWKNQNDFGLGGDYPFFGLPGNHDTVQWGGYQQILIDKYGTIEGANCEGDMGVQTDCTYRGLHFLLSGVGLLGTGHEAWIDDRLSSTEAIWSLCTWHLNQHDFQAGGKSDGTGYGVIQACANHGAMVLNGHEHSYSRTLTLTDPGNEGAGHGAEGDPANPVLKEGQTFVVVNGLGGVGMRDYESSHDSDTWWATIFADNRHFMNGVEQPSFYPAVGVLFIDFYVDGDPNKAYAYMKTIHGDIVDEFTITRE